MITVTSAQALTRVARQPPGGRAQRAVHLRGLPRRPAAAGAAAQRARRLRSRAAGTGRRRGAVPARRGQVAGQRDQQPVHRLLPGSGFMAGGCLGARPDRPGAPRRFHAQVRLPPLPRLRPAQHRSGLQLRLCGMRRRLAGALEYRPCLSPLARYDCYAYLRPSRCALCVARHGDRATPAGKVA